METFTNLLTDAFSETTVPSFTDEDLDFLDCDKRSLEDERERVTENEGTRVQEAASQPAQVLGDNVVDVSSMAGNVCKEHSDDDGINEKNPKAVGVGLINIHRTPDCYTNLESEYKDKDSSSGDYREDFEEYGGKLKSLVSLSETRGRFSFEKDSVGVDEQILALEGSADQQVSGKEQAEAERNEEVSCFGKEPEQGHDMMTEVVAYEDDAQETDEEDLSSNERRIIQSGDLFFTENLTKEKDGGTNRRVPAEDTPTSPCISVQNLQDLIAEIDGEGSVKDIKDFSGDEHQEAGETFAEYPSDLSFFEYVEDDAKYEINNQLKASLFTADCCSNAQHDSALDSTGMDVWTGSAATSSIKEDKNEMIIKQDQRQSEDQPNPAKKQTEDVELYRVSSTVPSNCGPYYWSNSGDNLPEYSRWDLEELRTCYTAQDVDKKDTESCLVGVRQCPVMEISEGWSEDYKVIAASSQRFQENECLSSRQPETPAAPEISGGVCKETNWEPTEERIQAFYKYYDDDDDEEEDEENERQIKVQFCADPLSQVIHYESESSDSDSVSSSTDQAEDLSAADTSDDQTRPDGLQEMPVWDSPKTQKAETIPDRHQTHSCAGEHKCGRMLKLVLKTTLYTLMGILIFWILLFPDYLSHVFDN